MSIKRTNVLASLLAVVVFASVSNAAFIVEDSAYLSDLASGQTLTAGDKIFADFDVVPISTGGGALAPDPTGILVQAGQETTTGDYVLQFNLSLNASSGQTVNASIHFTVEIAPEFFTWYIEDTGLVLTGVSATGNGVVNVGESVWDQSPTITGANLLSSLSGSMDSSFAQLSDHDTFDLVKKIWVVKDISLTGGEAGSAHISEVLQSFSQFDTTVPEPASLALFGAGALLMARRRKA